MPTKAINRAKKGRFVIQEIQEIAENTYINDVLEEVPVYSPQIKRASYKTKNMKFKIRTFEIPNETEQEKKVKNDNTITQNDYTTNTLAKSPSNNHLNADSAIYKKNNLDRKRNSLNSQSKLKYPDNNKNHRIIIPQSECDLNKYKALLQSTSDSVEVMLKVHNDWKNWRDIQNDLEQNIDFFSASNEKKKRKASLFKNEEKEKIDDDNQVPINSKLMFSDYNNRSSNDTDTKMYDDFIFITKNKAKKNPEISNFRDNNCNNYSNGETNTNDNRNILNFLKKRSSKFSNHNENNNNRNIVVESNTNTNAFSNYNIHNINNANSITTNNLVSNNSGNVFSSNKNSNSNLYNKSDIASSVNMIKLILTNSNIPSCSNIIEQEEQKQKHLTNKETDNNLNIKHTDTTKENSIVGSKNTSSPSEKKMIKFYEEEVNEVNEIINKTANNSNMSVKNTDIALNNQYQYTPSNNISKVNLHKEPSFSSISNSINKKIKTKISSIANVTVSSNTILNTINTMNKMSFPRTKSAINQMSQNALEVEGSTKLDFENQYDIRNTSRLSDPNEFSYMKLNKNSNRSNSNDSNDDEFTYNKYNYENISHNESNDIFHYTSNASFLAHTLPRQKPFDYNETKNNDYMFIKDNSVSINKNIDVRNKFKVNTLKESKINFSEKMNTKNNSKQALSNINLSKINDFTYDNSFNLNNFNSIFNSTINNNNINNKNNNDHNANVINNNNTNHNTSNFQQLIRNSLNVDLGKLKPHYTISTSNATSPKFAQVSNPRNEVSKLTDSECSDNTNTERHFAKDYYNYYNSNNINELNYSIPNNNISSQANIRKGSTPLLSRHVYSINNLNNVNEINYDNNDDSNYNETLNDNFKPNIRKFNLDADINRINVNEANEARKNTNFFNFSNSKKIKNYSNTNKSKYHNNELITNAFVLSSEKDKPHKINCFSEVYNNNKVLKDSDISNQELQKYQKFFLRNISVTSTSNVEIINYTSKKDNNNNNSNINNNNINNNEFNYQMTSEIALSFTNNNSNDDDKDNKN